MSKETYIINCNKKRIEREQIQQRKRVYDSLIVVLINRGYNLENAIKHAQNEFKRVYGEV